MHLFIEIYIHKHIYVHMCTDVYRGRCTDRNLGAIKRTTVPFGCQNR